MLSQNPRAVRARERYRAIHGTPDTTAMKVIDYLETHGPMTIAEMTVLIQLRHDVKLATIRRAVWRMINDGRVVVVRYEDAHHPMWRRVVVDVPDEA